MLSLRHGALALLLGVIGCGGETSEGGTGGSSASSGSAGSAGAASSGGSSGSAGSAGSGGSAASGGASGTGGASGSSGHGGTGGIGPECSDDGDCTLFSDCCTCSAYGPHETPPPSCKLACIQPACAATGITKPSCVAGRCVAGYECDGTNVACGPATSGCAQGQVQTVSGGCFTGNCVPADECRTVTSCADCSLQGFACAAYDTQLGPEAHCVNIPEACHGDASCSCMGPSVCIAPFGMCTDFSGVRGVACACPTC